MFGLIVATASQSARGGPDAVPVMDLHSDILLRAIDNGVDLLDAPPWAQVTIPTMREGGVRDQVLAVWVNSGLVTGMDAAKRSFQMIDLFEAQAKVHAGDVGLARTVAESDALHAEGRIALWLWLEGGAPIADDLAMLRTYHRLGIRGMTLTWTNNLLWAGSSNDKENAELGLNDFGKDVVREMNRLGMVVDISHVSEKTFYDTLAITTDPVIASHSCCKALCDNARNMTDDQLRALATNGGVIGINAYSAYLSDAWSAATDEAEKKSEAEIEALKSKFGGNTRNPEYREARRLLLLSKIPDESRVTLDTYLNHIEHAAKIMGPEHVGLGSDFDGIWAFPEGLENASKWQSVAEGLRTRGWNEKDIHGVMNENVRRVFRKVIDE